ncbi:winged helix-turn-helix transcriptional regulator [Streptomyces nigrescens]|uniref:winged helix-turn-helix transcriptional regulator n=1 Tax=Streptomyces nigrescens TaxID=1920 RepID=UPI0036F9AD07
MTTTKPSASTQRSRVTDMRRVEESLGMLAPRWSAWTLLTLKETGPQRPLDIRKALPMPSAPVLSARLSSLTDAGLVERRATNGRLVTYGLTSRGRQVIPALDALAGWAQRHPLDGDDAPVAYAERIEEALLQLGGRHTAAVLWTLRERGQARVGDLHQAIAPQLSLPTMSLKLTQIAQDGLILRMADDQRAPYRLSAVAVDLAEPFALLSAWAAGRTPKGNVTHPVWNPAPTKTQPVQRSNGSNRPTIPATAWGTAAAPAPAARNRTVPPAPARQAQSAAWGVRLFSHAGQQPAATSAGSRAR